MTGGEMVECGQLMQAHAAGTTSPEQVVRMRTLMGIAKRDLPHDDPSTPDVDEGETAIAREVRLEALARQRADDFVRDLQNAGPKVLELVLRALVSLVRF